MNMFKTFLESIPKNRSQFVNELEIPEVTLTPYVWREPEECTSEECASEKSDSLVTDSLEDDRGTLSTDSSIPLSRAMTDSEIDYCRYKRMKNSNEAWKELKATMDTFPSDYLASLTSYYRDSYDDLAASCARERLRRYTDDLKVQLDKRYEEECRVFSSDDPGLEALEDAVNNLKYKVDSSQNSSDTF